MDTFSFSRLSLYETCPHRFYKKYVEGFEEPLTLPLALGKGVHKAIEELLKGRSFDEAVKEGMKEAEYHPEVQEKELAKLTRNASVNQFKHSTNLEIERHFTLPLSDADDTPKIQGFIDVLELNHITRITDWKTNRVMYDVLDNHQLGLYAWAISQMENVDHVNARLFFLRFRRESQYVFTKEMMENARHWAERTAREIRGKLDMVEAMPELKDELFPATPSHYCGHCPFSVECFRKFSPYSQSN